MTHSFDSSNEMHCPRCGFNYLHHGRVDVFNRPCEDAESVLTSVDGQMLHRVPGGGANPSSRRDGLRIHFWCESCGPGLWYIIAQHKGQTYTKWEVA